MKNCKPRIAYYLKVYNKDWRLVREIPAPKKAFKDLEKMVRMPVKLPLTTFYSFSFPITSGDIPLVEAAMNVKLDTNRDNYVIEVLRV